MYALAATLRITMSAIVFIASVGCDAARNSSSTGKTRTSTNTVPDFAGIAAMIEPTSSCPNILPQGMSNPFTLGTQSVTASDYLLVGCWQGTLEGKRFLLNEYFSSALGGGIAIQYGHVLVAHLMAGSGAPVIVRFTQEYVCNAEQGGAYFEAVNLRTGVRMDDEEAQRVCPPLEWPPPYVLGLGVKRYPVIWHSTKP